MSAELQRNNPLHGLKTETLLTELVEHYGWKILFTATRFKCFDINPTIKGSLKFLQKTEWARLKLESFYLYRFKRMPKPNEAEFHLDPRERGFEHGIVPLSFLLQLFLVQSNFVQEICCATFRFQTVQ